MSKAILPHIGVTKKVNAGGIDNEIFFFFWGGGGGGVILSEKSHLCRYYCEILIVTQIGNVFEF